MRSGISLIAITMTLVWSMSVFAEPWLYLGEGKEHLMPQLKEAVALISKQPECKKLTEGTWGEAGKDIPGKNGFMFRATCEVTDFPAWPYDNFWIAPGETDRSSIYRQRTGKFLSGGNK
jgi:hypothetical protein